MFFSALGSALREHPQGAPRETCQPPSVSLQLPSVTVQPASDSLRRFTCQTPNQCVHRKFRPARLLSLDAIPPSPDPQTHANGDQPLTRSKGDASVVRVMTGGGGGRGGPLRTPSSSCKSCPVRGPRRRLHVQTHHAHVHETRGLFSASAAPSRCRGVPPAVAVPAAARLCRVWRGRTACSDGPALSPVRQAQHCSALVHTPQARPNTDSTFFCLSVRAEGGGREVPVGPPAFGLTRRRHVSHRVSIRRSTTHLIPIPRLRSRVGGTAVPRLAYA